MSGVDIIIGAKDGAFHRTMDRVEERLSGLKEKVGFSFGEAFAGLAGGATIVAMADNMANFAEQVVKSSRAMGTTYERTQQLQRAIKDFDWTGVFSKSEKFASGALVKGSKEANVAKQLGISEGDLTGPNSLSQDALLTKMLKGTNGMDNTRATELFRNAGFKEDSATLIGNKQRILDSYGRNTASGEDLEKVMEMKESWEDLIDVVRIGLIPTFVKLVETAEGWIQKSAIALGIQKTMGDAKEQYAKEHGTRAGFIKTAGIEVTTGLGLLGNYFAHRLRGQTLTEGMDAVLKWHDEAKYGKGVLDSQVVGSAASRAVGHAKSIEDDLAARKAERHKQYLEEQAKLNGHPDRHAPTKETPKANTRPAHNILGEKIEGGSAAVKIGNLMGTDSTYRLHRLTEETNKILKDILKVMIQKYGSPEEPLANLTSENS